MLSGNSFARLRRQPLGFCKAQWKKLIQVLHAEKSALGLIETIDPVEEWGHFFNESNIHKITNQQDLASRKHADDRRQDIAPHLSFVTDQYIRAIKPPGRAVHTPDPRHETILHALGLAEAGSNAMQTLEQLWHFQSADIVMVCQILDEMPLVLSRPTKKKRTQRVFPEN